MSERCPRSSGARGASGRVARRALLAALGLAAFGSFESRSWAGSYLDRAVLLISEASRDNDFLRKRLYDRELARLVTQIAAGRLQAAKDTLVPQQVLLAHPHLLLMLEHYERAATAAGAGEARRYHELCRLALDEEQLFRGVLRQLGWTVPGRS